MKKLIALLLLLAVAVQAAVFSTSQATSGANAAVSITLTGVANTRWTIRSVNAFCSAGTSGITITDGGVTIFSTPAAEVGTTRDAIVQALPSVAAGNTMVVTLATCGVSNTGTLQVTADQT